MRLIGLLLSICFSLRATARPRIGYNRAQKPFVIREVGVWGESAYRVMFASADKCEEFFYLKGLSDSDAAVSLAEQTDVVSCTVPAGSASVGDAYGVTAQVVCSPGTSRRTMSIDCFVGGVPFGGAIIHLENTPGCEIDDAVARCGAAFAKYREMKKTPAQTDEWGGDFNVDTESITSEGEVGSTEMGEEETVASPPNTEMSEEEPAAASSNEEPVPVETMSSETPIVDLSDGFLDEDLSVTSGSSPTDVEPKETTESETLNENESNEDAV
jgi:hypothetical protein